jgi:hypothetical protein
MGSPTLAQFLWALHEKKICVSVSVILEILRTVLTSLLTVVVRFTERKKLKWASRVRAS